MISSPAVSPPRPEAVRAASGRPLYALQLGMGWAASPAGNGLDRMFSGLADHLPGAGVNVSAWATGTDASPSESPHRVRLFAPASASLPQRLWAVRRSLQSRNALAGADLVASHFALYTAPVLDLIGDTPLVVHFHGPWAAESAVEGASGVEVRLKHWLERTVYRRADRFIVLSTAFRDVLATQYGVDPSRIRVVPGGVDVDRFMPTQSQNTARSAWGLCPHRPLVVAVRRLVQRVGLDSLIDAVDLLRDAEPDLLLLIAGKGPLANRLQHRIQEQGLTRHVRLLGFVPDADLPTLYRAADVSIVPSTAWEGFGLVAAESLAAGTPALVTPVGGLPEVVRPLSESLVLADHTPQALADGLKEAFRGGRPLPSSEDCYRHARTHFDWPVIAAQTHDVYAEVCA
jgi:glycogen(starch) synthase